MLDNPFQFVEHDKRARPKRFVGSAGRFPTNETQRPRRFASDPKPERRHGFCVSGRQRSRSHV